MTIVNASTSTEAVFITLGSNQFDYSVRDPAGNNITPTIPRCSRPAATTTRSPGPASTPSDPSAGGLADLIEVDLSNNDFGNPDVVISGITRPNAFGNPFTNARLDVITNSADDFFNEVLALNDTMTGSAFGDTFKSGGGNDVLNMGNGNDTAFGGDGTTPQRRAQRPCSARPATTP